MPKDTAGKKECYYFVGGNSPLGKSGNANAGSAFAGGCTKAWWDNEFAIRLGLGDTQVQAKANLLGRLMATDGSPVVSGMYPVTSAMGVEPAKISAAPGVFSSVEAGMTMYMEENQAMIPVGGIIEIVGVAPDGSWVEFDAWLDDFSTSVTVYIGGAWKEFNQGAGLVAGNHYFSQSVFINKDLSIKSSSDFWDMNLHSGGNNTFLHVQGFNRVPGDLTEQDGDYYQSIKDSKTALDTDCWVNVDMSAGSTLAVPTVCFNGAQNVIFEGIRFHGIGSTGPNNTLGSTVECTGIYIKHCIVVGDTDDHWCSVEFRYGKMIVIQDSWLVGGEALNTYASENLFCIGCIFQSILEYESGWAIDINYTSGAILFSWFDCDTTSMAGWFESNYLLFGNTFSDQSTGFFETSHVNTPHTLFLVNNIFACLLKTNKVFMTGGDVGSGGGAAMLDNNCVYSVGTNETLDVIADNTFFENPCKTMNTIEENPNLDSEKEPLNGTVRNGGLPNVLGDTTSIGAVNTMNTTVIENAVAAGVANIKSKTDNLPDDPAGVSDLASVDTSACKLAADGLDNVIVEEPTGDPTGWSFVKCLRWLIMRFMNKHTSDNFSGIVVHKSDDTTLTTQAVSDASGVKSVGKVQ